MTTNRTFAPNVVLEFTYAQFAQMPPALTDWLRCRAWRNRIDHYSRVVDGKRVDWSIIHLEMDAADAAEFWRRLGA